MNDAIYTALDAYIRQLADLLGMRDWVVLLSRGPAKHENYAEIWTSHYKDEAMVMLNEDYTTYSPEDQRLHITHELLHIQTCRLRRLITRLAEHEHDKAIGFVNRLHNEEEEILVDRLSRAIAPFLPLPEAV